MQARGFDYLLTNIPGACLVLLKPWFSGSNRQRTIGKIRYMHAIRWGAVWCWSRISGRGAAFAGMLTAKLGRFWWMNNDPRSWRWESGKAFLIRACESHPSNTARSTGSGQARVGHPHVC